jgi:hypothetical protein
MTISVSSIAEKLGRKHQRLGTYHQLIAGVMAVKEMDRLAAVRGVEQEEVRTLQPQTRESVRHRCLQIRETTPTNT